MKVTATLIKEAIYELLLPSVSINACIEYDGNHVANSNWGDDINYHFLSTLFNRRIFPLSRSLLRYIKIRSNYLIIGSTISMLANNSSIIWGAGVISNKAPLRFRPRKVLAVRGPLTRKWLQENGVSCPAVYGDPAMLVPRIYNPKREVKYKLGLIPHYTDLANDHVQRFTEKNKDVKLINIRDYGSWTDFVDNILSCETIVSSSLHGLIISDAYSIPNAWLEPSPQILGGDFKFRDYFESVNQTDRYHVPLELNEIEKGLNKWKAAKIDLVPLIQCCPFDISNLLNDDERG